MRRLLERLFPGRLGAGFRWLVAAAWSANLGDGFAFAAGPLLVASQTRNPTLVALATLLQRLPWLLFGLVGGAVADRVNRVVLTATVEVLRAGLLTLLAVAIVTGEVDIAVVLTTLFLLGTAEVFSDTAATTVLPSLVGADDLTLANSRVQTGFVTLYQLAGPPVGAALFALGACRAPVDAGGGGRRVPLGGVPRGGTHPRPDDPDLQRHLRGRVVGPRAVRRGAAAPRRRRLGLLTTTSAVGGLLGTTGYGWLTRRVSLGNIMRAGLVIETFTHLSLALTTSPAVALAVMVVFGAHAFVWGTTSITIRQRAVPEPLQGRVSSVNSLGVFGGLVLGAALGGPIAERFGVTAPFRFAFVGSAVFVVVMWRQLTHIAHDDARRPRQPGQPRAAGSGVA